MLAARAKLLPLSGEIGQGEKREHVLQLLPFFTGDTMMRFWTLHLTPQASIWQLPLLMVNVHSPLSSLSFLPPHPPLSLLPLFLSHFPPPSHSIQTPSPPTVPLPLFYRHCPGVQQHHTQLSGQATRSQGGNIKGKLSLPLSYSIPSCRRPPLSDASGRGKEGSLHEM